MLTISLLSYLYQVNMTFMRLNQPLNYPLSEARDELINRIPGECLDIKFTRLRFKSTCCITRQSLVNQHDCVLKPCLLNLLSKDTHLVFSIFTQKEIYKGTVSLLICILLITGFNICLNTCIVNTPCRPLLGDKRKHS